MKELSILNSVNEKSVYLEPFPYLAAGECLPEKIYEELSRTYPKDSDIISMSRHYDSYPGENIRVDIPGGAFLKNISDFSQIWQDFVSYHLSEDFRDDVLRVFGSSIERYYPELFPALSAYPCAARFTENDIHPISLDCQIGINTPNSTSSSVIGPHTDCSVELWAGLLYFRNELDYSKGGDLTLWRWKKRVSRSFNKNKVANKKIFPFRTIEYRANTLVFFLNTFDSIHSVTSRTPSSVSRRLVNVIGETYNVLPEGNFVKTQEFTTADDAKASKFIKKLRNAVRV